MPSIIGRTTRNLPGGLTLDTDSELDVSKIQLRHHLANANTTRNIRNRTIDVPHVASDLHTKKPGNYYSNLSKIKRLLRNWAGSNWGNFKKLRLKLVRQKIR